MPNLIGLFRRGRSPSVVLSWCFNLSMSGSRKYPYPPRKIRGCWGSQKPNFLQEGMKLNWNFWRWEGGGWGWEGGGWGVVKPKNLLWGRYGYCLEQHNTCEVYVGHIGMCFPVKSTLNVPEDKGSFSLFLWHLNNYFYFSCGNRIIMFSCYTVIWNAGKLLN